MDIYLTALALGGVGLVGMAVGGLGQHGHSGHSGHAGDAGHAGHVGHAGHDANVGHAAGHGPHGHDGHSGHGPNAQQGSSSPFVALMSPRVLFSVALGLGTAGVALQNLLSGPLLFAASLGLGILFERVIVTPIWNFAFRFGSNPAANLEGSVMDEATAVTTFDKNGQGLIAVEVDGQIMQILGTLQSGDREMKVKVPAGARLRIQDVDAARNRCTVSLI